MYFNNFNFPLFSMFRKVFGITVKVSLASLFSLTEFVRFVCCSSSFREITPNSKLAAMNHQNIINSFDDNNPKGLSKTSNWVTDKCYTTWMRWATLVIFSFTTPRCRLWDDFFFSLLLRFLYFLPFFFFSIREVQF